MGIRNNPDLVVAIIPNIRDGCRVFKFQSASGQNANNVKLTRGQLYGFNIFNNLNSEVRICFHNKTNPVVGQNIFTSFVLNKQQPQLFSFPQGIEFDTAISFTLAFGILDSGVSNVTANNVVGSIFYR